MRHSCLVLAYWPLIRSLYSNSCDFQSSLSNAIGIYIYQAIFRLSTAVIACCNCLLRRKVPLAACSQLAIRQLMPLPK